MPEFDKCILLLYGDEKSMRAKPVTADERYRLIMECRSSSLIDYQWCLEHNIKPGTFYNWVKRLCQKGCSDIPDDEVFGQIKPVFSRVCGTSIQILQQNCNKFATHNAG